MQEISCVYAATHTERLRKLEICKRSSENLLPPGRLYTLQALIYGIFKHAAAAIRNGIRTILQSRGLPRHALSRFWRWSGFRFYLNKPSQKTTMPSLPLSVS